MVEILKMTATHSRWVNDNVSQMLPIQSQTCKVSQKLEAILMWSKVYRRRSHLAGGSLTGRIGVELFLKFLTSRNRIKSR